MTSLLPAKASGVQALGGLRGHRAWPALKAVCFFPGALRPRAETEGRFLYKKSPLYSFYTLTQLL